MPLDRHSAAITCFTTGTLLATDDSGEKHRFDLGAGEGFLIFPGQMNIYFADIEDPWEYTWVELTAPR